MSRPDTQSQRRPLRFLRTALLACAGAGATACASGPVTSAAGPAPVTLSAAAETITADDVAAKVGVLAHDSMKGRDTPSPELDEAARWMADRFAALGLEPAGEDGGYMDPFEVETAGLAPGGTFFGVAGEDDAPTYGVDYYLVPSARPVEALAYWGGEATGATSVSSEARGRFVFFELPVPEFGPEWQRAMMGGVRAAMGGGAVGVVFVLAPEVVEADVKSVAHQAARQQLPFPIVGITRDAAEALAAQLDADLDALLAADEPGPLGTRPLAVRSERTVETVVVPNVAALRRGSDPALRDTYIVLTAHFDHLGVGSPDASGDSIYNGADDNASGTAAVLEVAEAFAALDTAPARSVLFLLVSGEEDGLLGSEAWVAEPTVPLDAVVANINLDMVGRNAPDTVIGIGQEYSTLEETLQAITSRRPELGLDVILDPVPEQRYFFRSDQLPFILEGIPAVFFTGHDHEDYHQVTDEADRLDNDKVARVARLTFYLAHDIASSADAPAWTNAGRDRLREILGQRAPF